MNVRLLDTYDIVRNVVNAYHQSRQVTGFESHSDNGKRGKGKEEEFPFGPLKGENERVKCDHTDW